MLLVVFSLFDFQIFKLAPGFFLSFGMSFLFAFILLLITWKSESKSGLDSLLIFGLIPSVLYPVLSDFILILLATRLSYLWSFIPSENKLLLGVVRLESKLKQLPAIGVQWILICLIVVNSVRLYRISDREILLPKEAVLFAVEHKVCELSLSKGISGYVGYYLNKSCNRVNLVSIENSKAAILNKLDPSYQLLIKDKRWENVRSSSGVLGWSLFLRKS